MVFRKRAGIVLLHGGVALMMCSELWTGLTANEAQMRIAEGETANFASDIRTTELAVIDHSNPDHDRVTVVPASLLIDQCRRGRAHRACRLAGYDSGPSLAGEFGFARRRTGRRQPRDRRRRPRTMWPTRLAPAPASARMQTVDQPAAYVELFSKATGESLGTYLVAAALPEQPIEVDGPTYDLALRFKRSYYPYSLTLKDFRFDRYVGTNTPKNYSSLVQLKDPTQNVDREVLIWMNNPLRYAGTTFYQPTSTRRPNRPPSCRS